MNQRSYIYGLVAVVLVIGSIGYHYFYRNHQSPENLTVSSAADDWQTYTNTTYNYTVKYPGTWYVDRSFSDDPYTPRGPAPYVYMGGDTSFSNYSDSYINKYQHERGQLALPTDYLQISLLFTKVDPTVSLSQYLNSIENVPSGTVGSIKDENVILNGVPGIKRTWLNISGIGGNTKSNNTTIFLKRDNEIVEIGYGFDDTVENVIPIADQIIDSFSLQG